MEKKMFCFQCQEAANNEACTQAGVCQKSSTLANLMDIYKDSLKQLSKQISEYPQDDLKVKQVKIFIVDGLFKLITNANFNHDVFEAMIKESYQILSELKNEEIDYVIKENAWQSIGTLQEEDIDLRSVKELVMTGLMGLAAYVSHAYQLGYQDESIEDFLIETLAKFNSIKDLNELIELTDQTGAYGVKAMALLDKANTESYGNPQVTQVNLGVNNRPGILVSGHDLHDLAQLLEQSKDSGIDIYTHSEMLPAHYYPELNKYDHLYGNYGNAWWQQKEEFSSFNGPILFTTNCIVPPAKDANYLNRTYTTGNCGHSEFKHIPSKDNVKDFSSIIKEAQSCLAPIELEKGSITGGFAHSQVFELAPLIVENIKNGSIKKFVVMAGCDGRHQIRDYYTDFAQALPDDVVILTAGCAKYRYNKLNLGDINGIPRVLDAGQCNDSYSLAIIALKLQEIFELEDINDLPISYNIAWYEQKAVIVLLALLNLNVKNIKLGPSLPAFITPNVASFLIDTYGISTIGNVNDDLKELI